MSIQAPGVGSGLDVNNIVTQLMAIERQPIDRLSSKKTLVDAQVSAYGSLKSKISTFQTAMKGLSSASKFQVFSGKSNNESLFTVTADSKANVGSHTVNVIELAQRDKIGTKGYTDTSSVVGEGTLTFTVGAKSFDVVVDATNNSVAKLRDSINNAADNTGVTASIVTDDAGAHLVLSSNNTGLENALTVSVADSDGINTDDTGLSSLAYGGGVAHRAAITTALDAVVEIDGFTVTSASNVISTALEGVSITAKAKGTSTIDVARDDTKITAAVQSFADAYNALRTELTTQRKKGGTLEADSTLLTIERQLSGILNSGDAVAGSNFSYLSQVGLKTNDLGKMEIDTAGLTKVLNSDFGSFVNLFSAKDTGIASRLESLAASFLKRDGGLIVARQEGLNTQLKGIADQTDRLENRMVSIERRIRAQFSTLDTLVSSLSSTGNFLTQQLASMPAVNRK